MREGILRKGLVVCIIFIFFEIIVMPSYGNPLLKTADTNFVNSGFTDRIDYNRIRYDTIPENSPPPLGEIPLYYHNNEFEWAVGLENGGTGECAIRLTPLELTGYNGWNIIAVRFLHSDYPTHYGHIKIYDDGADTSPGPLLTSVPITASGYNFYRIDLPTSVIIDSSKDIWISLEFTHGSYETPWCMDPGPAIDGKGDWAYTLIGGWRELQYQSSFPLDNNFIIEAIVSNGNQPILVSVSNQMNGDLNLYNDIPSLENIPVNFIFEKNLQEGNNIIDVKYLQMVLNSDPDTKLDVNPGEDGSPGFETTVFGPKTKAAVIKFQNKYADDTLTPLELSVATGKVGLATRTKLNEILGVLKHVPNDWVFEVVNTYENNEIHNGYTWWKVKDKADNVDGWITFKKNIDQTILLDINNQNELANKVTTQNDLNDRINKILEVVKHYYLNTDTQSSLYSSNDNPNGLSIFNVHNFPVELILAIIAVESASLTPSDFINEKISYDYGHGLTQTTFIPVSKDIQYLQTLLQQENPPLYKISLPIYDEFDKNTKDAVKAFQTKYGIESTGVVGPITRGKLNDLIQERILQNNPYNGIPTTFLFKNLLQKGFSDRNPGDSFDNRGAGSGLKIPVCEGLLPLYLCQNQNHLKNSFERTYGEIAGSNDKQYIENTLYGKTFKYYSDTSQSFYANIKDGLRILQLDYNDALVKNPNNPTIAWIGAVWRYNHGFFGPIVEGDTYLSRIADRLEHLTDYYGDDYQNKLQGIDFLSSEIKQDLINKLRNYKTGDIKSPALLRIYDSQGHALGPINGSIVNDINNSDYYNESFLIVDPTDIYYYELLGLENGTYGLEINSCENYTITNFTAEHIPILVNATHRYSINWTILTEGDNGVTVQIDADGNGVFEQNFTVGEVFQSPVAYFYYSPDNILADESVNFNATESFYNPDLNASYQWNFGDGEIGEGVIANHTYSSYGTYIVTLQVTDSNGMESILSKNITVEDIPDITDYTPTIGNTGDPFIFNALITDSRGVASAYVEYWYGEETHNRISLKNKVGDLWEETITICDILSTLHYYISANDTLNNQNMTIIKDIAIFDNKKPIFVNIESNPLVQVISGFINITAIITDNIELDEAYLIIQYPDLSVENISITQNNSIDLYYCNKTYEQPGNYQFHLWAADTSGNSNLSAPYNFLINSPPNTPNNPNPINGETDTPVDMILTWDGGDPDINDVVLYDIYFGITNPPSKVVGNQTNTIFNPGILDYSQTYYWRIVSWDSYDVSTTGPLWYFTTILDITPPITTITLSGSIGDNYWYVSPVTITLTAFDSQSGVFSTMYNIDYGSWKNYISPIIITDDGYHTITYYSIDNIGNLETPKTADFKIDLNPPMTNHSISGILGRNGWFIDSVTITVYSIDNSSGINHSYYSIDNEEWNEITTPLVVDSDGLHTVEYYSIDNAGNIEPVKGPFSFKIDQTAPMVTLTKEQMELFTLKFSAQVEDDISGIDYVEFFLDGVLQYNDSFSPYEWTWVGTGDHTVTATAYDMAGNYQSQSMSTPYELIQGIWFQIFLQMLKQNLN